MEFFNYCVDNEYDEGLGYDRIWTGRGRIILVGDKAPHDVVVKIIFIWEEKGGGVGIL